MDSPWPLGRGNRRVNGDDSGLETGPAIGSNSCTGLAAYERLGETVCATSAAESRALSCLVSCPFVSGCLVLTQIG